MTIRRDPCVPVPSVRTAAAVMLVCGAVCGSVRAQGPTFQGVGFMPGGMQDESYACAVSADGQFVVGQGTSSIGVQAFRWTAGGGFTPLGTLAGYSSTPARGVSGDGSVVAGYSAGAVSDQAVRWTNGGGLQGLGFLTGGTTSAAYGISADGAGLVRGGNSAGPSQPFRWTVPDGV